MSIAEYAEAVVAQINNITDNELDVSVTTVNKNGVVFTGISIKEFDAKVAPCIYIDKMYETDTSVENAAAEVLELYKNNKGTAFGSFASEFTWEKIKDKLNLFIVNYEKNLDTGLLLKPIPNTDLAYGIRVVLSDYASVKICRSHLEYLDVSAEDIFAAASIRSTMITTMAAMFGSTFDIPNDGPQMYIVTNDSKVYGAVSVMDKEVQEELSYNLGGDFYILPSSVHEVLCIPTEGAMVSDLASMVYEINRTQVQPEEVLSDSVYKYDSMNGTIAMVGEAA